MKVKMLEQFISKENKNIILLRTTHKIIRHKNIPTLNHKKFNAKPEIESKINLHFNLS